MRCSAHAQRLAQQTVDRHLADALGARLARLQGDRVAVPQSQLGDVLDRQDALVRRCEVEQSCEHRGLAAPRASRDEHVAAVDDQFAQHRGGARRAQACRDEFVEARRRDARQPDRDCGAPDCDRGQHRVHAHSVAQPHVRAGVQLIEVPLARSDQAGGESMHGVGLCPPLAHLVEGAGAIEPQPADPLAHLHHEVPQLGVVEQGQEPAERAPRRTAERGGSAGDRVRRAARRRVIRVLVWSHAAIRAGTLRLAGTRRGICAQRGGPPRSPTM